MGNSNKATLGSSTSQSADALVADAISQYPVVIFSKTYCPYCVAAKSTITDAARSVANFQGAKVFELNRMGSLGRQVQSHLATLTGRSTVPNVFIGGKPMGGGDEIVSFHRDGVLRQMLAQAPAALEASKPSPTVQSAQQPNTQPSEIADNAIANNSVVIFSKTSCPYCSRAKSLLFDAVSALEGEKAAPKVIELDTMGVDGNAIQKYLFEKTGQRTVPNIFIGQQHAGGSDDVVALMRSGELAARLQEAYAGASPDEPVVVAPEAEAAPEKEEESARDSPVALVDDAIADGKVVVFSKSWCPFCVRVKDVLADVMQQLPDAPAANVIELDEMDDAGAAVQAYLHQKTGQRTVPNVFIGSEHIGGCDDIVQLQRAGQLESKLRAAFGDAVDADGSGEANGEEASAAKFVDDAVASQPVVVFSKTYCPYCAHVKQLIGERAAEFDESKAAAVFELDTMGAAGEQVQAYLHEKTGQRSVPNVFIGGEHVGGCDDTVALDSSGTLKEKLAAVFGATEGAASATAAKEATGGGGVKEIVLGAGCFWGVELAFQRVEGVVKTEVGYSNGRTGDLTYEAICSGMTGAAEVVKVSYDENVIRLEEILKIWEGRHDPTSINKQGNDIGTQYRSAIFTTDAAQMEVVTAWRNEAQARLGDIATDVEPVNNYSTAEDYHQRYLEKGGQNAAKGATDRIRCYG